MTARETVDIVELAQSLGLEPQDVEQFGRGKAKLVPGLAERLSDRPSGRLINVTAINPTPLGEGKTVVTIALAMALNRDGRRAIATLREPSLAPVFGVKGGGAGGGQATLVPASDINLHFTGDLHAVGAATNLLAALIDNHVARRLDPVIEPDSVGWQRVVDVCDKGLARIVTGLGHPRQALLRETGFSLTAASEIMAVLALASDLDDLRRRIGRIVVGSTADERPVTVADLKFTGAILTLLGDAIRPNLVQTCEGTPAIVHTGPFANIAHGNSSVIADRIALRLADYVVTESGFGSECGVEKFINIKCRQSGLKPRLEVLVCTLRALKFHGSRSSMRPGNAVPKELLRPDEASLVRGLDNLEAHLGILSRFGLPVVVAINRFPEDTEEELQLVGREAARRGADGVAVIDGFARGSAGACALAEQVIELSGRTSDLKFTYTDDLPLEEKFRAVARDVYGASGVSFSAESRRKLQRFTDWGLSALPICIAKTQYSLSHDPSALGRPSEFVVPIEDVRLSAGAGFVYGLAGSISTMPGLPREPAALKVDLDSGGTVTGVC